VGGHERAAGGDCDWRVKKWHRVDRSDDVLARLAAYCDNNCITS